MQFTLELVFADDAAILRCYGRMSSAEALALSRTVSPLLLERDVVVLDFSGVDAVDSGGLGTLTLLQLYVQSSGWKLRYYGLNRRVTDALERTGLNSVFDIYESEEDALYAARESAFSRR